MVPVAGSSAIESIGHDGQHLYVKYKGGKSYVHKGVSPERYDELMKAPSKGKFMNLHISRKHPGVAL